MNRLSRVALFTALASGTAGAQFPTKPPTPAPVKPAAIPAFQEATLPNGLRVMLVESHRQPVVSLALMMPAGESHDPSGKEGVELLRMTHIPLKEGLERYHGITP